MSTPTQRFPTSRRAFLKGSAAVLCSSALGSATAAAVSANAYVICESRSSRSTHFAQCLNLPCVAIAPDPGEALFDFENRLPQQGPAALIGLTQDSNQFLFAQTAAAHGYYTIYAGRHRYTNGTWSHGLQGNLQILTPLSRALAGGARWEAALADAMALLSVAPASQMRLTLQAAEENAAPTPDYLSSWILRRG